MHPVRLITAALALLIAAVAHADEPSWKKHTINPDSGFEGAGALDVDGDGKLDILSGAYWYRAPNWEKFKVRDVERKGTYFNDFADMPMDVNGDGKVDIITCSYFAKDVGWVENPGQTGKEWAYHHVDTPGESETAVLVDLTGDGVPEVLPNCVKSVVFYSLVKKGPSPEFRKYDLGNAAVGHGVGSGDVNGDGRVDLLTPKGWFEAPANPAEGKWAWHPDWNLGGTGIQILAKDIDGDGKAEIIWGMGHARGLFWMAQTTGADGKTTWTKGVIDPQVTSVHTQLWADIDGDGKANELVSGKRVYAHEVEEGDTEASLVAWYDFDKASKTWRKHVIFQGEPATNAPDVAHRNLRDAMKDFPKGTAGTGLQVAAVDIDGDGDTDLVCPGKSGLYLFENLSKSR